MRLEIERRHAIEDPSEMQVRSAIMALRSYGPSSFASLTDENGNYLQVAGGAVTCLLERRDGGTNRHYRAYRDNPSTVFSTGTALVFGGGQVKLAADEWFTASIVADAFLAFLRGEDLPASIKWRDVTRILNE